MKVQMGKTLLNVECSGNNNGPVVVMAHSLGCNLHMWDWQMSVLEPDYHVIRIDMRGHGLSDVPDGPYTLELLADDVIGVMDSLKITQAHWVGLSIGGMIGQSLLLRYPTRFLSATLCDTASTQPAEAASIWKARIEKIATNGLSSIVDSTMERWFTAEYLETGASAIDDVRKQLAATTDAGYIACCHAIMKLDYIDQLSTINTPVSLIVGAQDVATPVSASKEMHKRIPNSELHVLDNASHISNVEQADAFNKALLEFLQANQPTPIR